MYEENRTGSVIKEVLLQVILVVVFVFLLLWLFPTKGYVDNKLSDGLNPLYQDLFNNHIATMQKAAQSYYTKDRLPKKVGDKVSITLGEMLDKKLLTSFVDSNNKQCNLTGSYVEVTKMDKEYMMKVSLNCSDKSDYIITYLGCYNYCEDYICQKQDITTNSSTTNNNNGNVKPVAKKYQYEYKLVQDAKYSDWSNWSSWDTTKIKEDDFTKVEITQKRIQVGTKKVETGSNVYYENAQYKLVSTGTKVNSVLKCPEGYTAYDSSSNTSKLCISTPSTKTSKATTITSTVDAKVRQVKVCPDGRITTNDWCFATVNSSDQKNATLVKTYGDWTYSGRQTFVGTKVTTNTTKYVYVSSKDEVDCSNGCKTVTKNIYDVYTRSQNTTYNCNAYPGYTLSGTKCVKNNSSVTSVYGTWTVKNEYYCENGSTPVNGKCEVVSYTTQVSDNNTICKYGSYDAASNWCYTRGERVCPSNTTGTIKNGKCEVQKNEYYCDGDAKLVTKNGSKKCEYKEISYKIEKEYDYVTHYRYKTRYLISSKNDYTEWSNSNNDKDLIEKGYKYTGIKKEI